MTDGERSFGSACRLMLSAALAAFGLSACGHGVKDLQPPIQVPFDAGRPSAETEVRVHIKKTDRYAIGLYFYYDKDDPQGRAMSELLGVFKINPDGSTSEPGVPASFKVSVRPLDAEAMILEQVAKRPQSLPSSGSRYIDVAKVRLDPGRYLVRFAVMDNSPELSSVRTELFISRAYQGK